MYEKKGKESHGKNAIITICGPVISLSTSRHQNVAEWHLLDCPVTTYEHVYRQQLVKRRFHNLKRAVNKPAFSSRQQRQTDSCSEHQVSFAVYDNVVDEEIRRYIGFVNEEHQVLRILRTLLTPMMVRHILTSIDTLLSLDSPAANECPDTHTFTYICILTTLIYTT